MKTHPYGGVMLARSLLEGSLLPASEVHYVHSIGTYFPPLDLNKSNSKILYDLGISQKVLAHCLRGLLVCGIGVFVIGSLAFRGVSVSPNEHS